MNLFSNSNILMHSSLACHWGPVSNFPCYWIFGWSVDPIQASWNWTLLACWSFGPTVYWFQYLNALLRFPKQIFCETITNSSSFSLLPALNAKALHYKETLCKTSEVQRFLNTLVAKPPEVGHFVSCSHPVPSRDPKTNTPGRKVINANLINEFI